MNMNVEFIKGIIGTDPIITDTKPQIVFIGRSNVGKSSVINALVGEKIARSSSTPGKTREINFFLVKKKKYLVDLPGYGYAKVSEKHREKLKKHILWYMFESGAPIHRIILIVDTRVGITSFDEEILRALFDHEIPVTLVANKIDKLTQKEMHLARTRFEKQGLKKEDIIWMSAKTGKGKGDLRLFLEMEFGKEKKLS
ncbi:MAG: YihA family ribosome biogenesis GTP-binding protein [Candidatus Moranbacteria bacterium]|nr:YihA family ribosome biogenesis GTP-binding protein [Candidatus Moranbacteria bacterium]